MTSQLRVSTFYGLIKLLATCAAGSHVVAESLLQVCAVLATYGTHLLVLSHSFSMPFNFFLPCRILPLLRLGSIVEQKHVLLGVKAALKGSLPDPFLPFLT